MTGVSSVPPAPTHPRPYRFPHVERLPLASGAGLAVASLTKLPLVTVTAVFTSAGARDDPPGREGLAQLVAAMLLEGTDALDGAALATTFETLGTGLAAAADWDAASVSLTVQPSRLDAAVRALAHVLQAPAFPARELERLRAEHRAARLQVAADPRNLGGAAFAWSCYADASRFRRPLDGTTASVEAITRDDVVNFWTSRYARSTLTIVMAGDVDTATAIAAAEVLSGAVGDARPVPGTPSTEPRSRERTLTLVEKEGAAQAELRIGHVGVARSHPSFFPLTVMNAVLGGLFSSRINLNLRERHGYTYGAFSNFDWRVSPGPWGVSTAVKSEVCGDAIREVLAEIDRIRATEIAQDELLLASDYLVGVFPLRFETTDAVAAALASQAVYALPDDYFDSYRERIAAVSCGDVLAAARAHLDPAALQLVVVGEPSLVRAPLAEHASAGLSIRSPEHVETAP